MKHFTRIFETPAAVARIGLSVVALLVAISASGKLTDAQTAPSAACQDGAETTQAYSYSNGWLVCLETDANQGSEQVYEEQPVGSGNFVFIKGAGGWYLPADLTQFAGVDAADAQALVSDLSQQLGLPRGFDPEPRLPLDRHRASRN